MAPETTPERRREPGEDAAARSIFEMLRMPYLRKEAPDSATARQPIAISVDTSGGEEAWDRVRELLAFAHSRRGRSSGN